MTQFFLSQPAVPGRANRLPRLSARFPCSSELRRNAHARFRDRSDEFPECFPEFRPRAAEFAGGAIPFPRCPARSPPRPAWFPPDDERFWKRFERLIRDADEFPATPPGGHERDRGCFLLPTGWFRVVGT